MEDIDKNGDGKINLEEYIGEFARKRSRTACGKINVMRVT